MSTEVTAPGATPPPKRKGRFWNRTGQFAAFLGAVASIIYFGALRPNAAVLAEALAACFATFALLRFRSIKRFKGPGFELETQERRLKEATKEARDATQEAKATVAQVRDLAAVLGHLTLDGLALRMHPRRIQPSTLSDTMTKVAEVLKHAGCAPEQITTAVHTLDASIRVGLCERIELAIPSSFSGDEEPQKRCRELMDAIRSRKNQGEYLAYVPSIEYRRLCEGYGVLHDATLRHIENYERYEQTWFAPTYEEDKTNYLPPGLGGA